MVMMTSLPFAVSKPMTTVEIENFVEGSLPNGTIIENVTTGAIAVVNAGMPQYLPYAEGIIPDVSDFVTQEEIEDFVTQQDVDSVFVRKDEQTSTPATSDRLLISNFTKTNKVCRPLALGSEGQVLGIVDGALKFRDPPVSGGGYEFLSKQVIQNRNSWKMEEYPPIGGDVVGWSLSGSLSTVSKPIEATHYKIDLIVSFIPLSQIGNEYDFDVVTSMPVSYRKVKYGSNYNNTPAVSVANCDITDISQLGDSISYYLLSSVLNGEPHGWANIIAVIDYYKVV